MGFIMAMEPGDFIDLLNKGLEKREEEKEWAMWLALYPYMNEKTYISFEDHLKRQRQPKAPTRVRPADEILAEADRIRKAVEKRKSLP